MNRPLFLAGVAILSLLLIVAAIIPAYAQDSFDNLDPYTVNVDGRPYTVKYNITGGDLQSIKANSTYSTIAIMIQANSDGRLLIDLPGSLLNSISLNIGSDVAVFLDNIDVFPNMTFNNCDATLEIPFQKGSKQIDIVGTFLVGGGTMPKKGHFFDATVDGGKGFKIETVANADTCNFSLDQAKKQLHIGMSGPTNETGFFQIALPHEFLGGPYTVLVEGRPVEFKSIFSNATGRDTTTVSFQYDGNKVHNVDIIGTTAIPEFGPAAIAAVAASMATIMIIVRFKRQ